MSPDTAIERAMASVAAAAPRAAADRRRPAFHFGPPAQWMNDPNGPIRYRGVTHLFYQHNPYGDGWDHMHWGHARSPDLVRWEHLPIALAPADELGEQHCFSGCCALDASGSPVILYTSVPPREGGRPHEQWAALPLDDDLVRWSRAGSNPAIGLAAQGGPRFRGDWRDPFVFDHAGRRFLVLGASPVEEPTRPAAALYEAASPDLLRWTYRGLLFRIDGDERSFVECPNFVRLGDRWLLIASPNRPPVRWWVGSFDPDAARFEPDHGRLPGVVDHGADFYATNVLPDGPESCVILGWVRNFPRGRGWNGCLALPRHARLRDGALVQEPIAALATLRGEQVRHGSLILHEEPLAVGGDAFAAEGLEVELALTPAGCREVCLDLVPAADDGERVSIALAGGALTLRGSTVPAATDRASGELRLRLFFDRSVVELFVDGGRECLTRVVPSAPRVRLELRARGGGARVASLSAWTLRPGGSR